MTEKLRRFSAFRLADGTFWEDPSNRELTDHAKAAHQSLIQAVVDADQALKGDKNPLLRRLLLLMVLIKYLEDRRVFPSPGWFGKWHKGAKSFFDVLRGGQPDEVYRLLEFLERKFNGDVFKMPEGGAILTKMNLSRFADLVEAKTLKGQMYLWEQYSFEHLPVEIISHLYQRFVGKGHGAVYTPPFLASLLLDQAMPYQTLSGTERILDPSCGSGVFLIRAFRRLVNVWRSKNGWKKPPVPTLKKILKRSIHGVDLDFFAIDLATFSLSLGVCDVLSPNVIWDKLKFDRLQGENLCEADFFSKVLERHQGKSGILKKGFDIVIGNPPFMSKLIEDGPEVDRLAKDETRDGLALPDKQVAYLFLEQSLALLRKGGRLCMIQPAGFLYNRQPKAFRRKVFSKNRIETILDFASIRKLYDADPKTVAILAHADQPPEDHQVRHWTFRRTASVLERLCFELDHYDRFRVPQQIAESEPGIWRANLLGGGRLVEMARRISKMRTLADYVDRAGWHYGEGFMIGNRKKSAAFLTDQPSLPTKALSTSGIDRSEIIILDEKSFEAPRNEDLFTGPLILVKEHESLPMDFWDGDFLSFPHKIVGISATSEERSSLRWLYNLLCKEQDFFRFVETLNGSQSLLGKSTAILKKDIDSLPIPENPDDLSLSFWEHVLCEDLLEYMTDYVRLGQNSRLLKEAADEKDLETYSTLFVRMLRSIYDNLQAGEPVFLEGLTIQPFYFGDDRPDLPWLSEDAERPLHKMIYEDHLFKSLRTIRVLRFYSENVLLLIKPDRLRYWTPSTAIRDADETLVDLRKWGY